MIKIFLLEDEPFNAKLVQMHLKRAHEKNYIKPNIEFLHCTTIEESQNKLPNYKPDLCILDLRLPDSDGVETLKSIKKLTDAPIIVFSGSVNLDTVNECYRLGIYTFLTKPIDNYLATLSTVTLQALESKYKDDLYKKLL